MNGSEQPNSFTVFRTDETSQEYLYRELRAGCLRQGWGSPGLALKTADGHLVEKPEWEANHNNAYGKAPGPKKYANLRHMLDLNEGEVVVVPKMPEQHQFTIARVQGGYEWGHR